MKTMTEKENHTIGEEFFQGFQGACSKVNVRIRKKSGMGRLFGHSPRRLAEHGPQRQSKQDSEGTE